MQEFNQLNHTPSQPINTVLIIGFYALVLYSEQEAFKRRKLKILQEKYHGKKIIIAFHTILFLIFYPIYFSIVFLSQRGYQGMSDYFWGMWEMLILIVFFPIYIVGNIATIIQSKFEKDDK